MSYEFYRLVHFVGLAAVFVALGGATLHAINGGTHETNRARGLMAATHGVGLLLVLVAGFGMLAKHNLGMGGWVHAKLTLWVLLGALVAVPLRMPGAARALWFVLPLLLALGGWLAVTKPF